MRTIGIVGGSFNPPHAGHRHIAQATFDATGADEIWLWLGMNIFKDPSAYASTQWRLDACNVMMRDKPWARVKDTEKDFCDLRTATTMTMLAAMYPQTRFAWIFGEENFKTFHTWNRVLFEVDGKQVPDWQYMMHNFPIVVMQRVGSDGESAHSVAAKYGVGLFLKNPADLKEKTGWSFVPSPPVPIASSTIRDALRNGAPDPKTLGLDPIVEQMIRRNRLFRVDGAPAMTAVHVRNNEVRFDTFLMLARMTNLCKAVMVRHLPNISATQLLNFASLSWDKTAGKGELGKTSEVPGELADNLISLHWLIAPLSIAVPGSEKESQRAVAGWCDKNFPGAMSVRLESLIEEMTELCVCENLEKHRLLNLMREIFISPDVDTVADAAEKAFTTLNAYAAHMNLSLTGELNIKMAANRLRPPVQSAARYAAKRQKMGLQP